MGGKQRPNRLSSVRSILLTLFVPMMSPPIAVPYLSVPLWLREILSFWRANQNDRHYQPWVGNLILSLPTAGAVTGRRQFVFRGDAAGRSCSRPCSSLGSTEGCIIPYQSSHHPARIANEMLPLPALFGNQVAARLSPKPAGKRTAMASSGAAGVSVDAVAVENRKLQTRRNPSLAFNRLFVAHSVPLGKTRQDRCERSRSYALIIAWRKLSDLT